MKARLVARGFEKIRNENELRVPVAKITTFRMFLAICVKPNFEIRRTDVKNAYLNGKLSETVCIEFPKFVKAAKNEVCRLNTAVYGLKEAALI